LAEKEKRKLVTECSMEYVMGSDGYYVKKVNPLFSATVKVDRHPEMPAVDEDLIYHGRRIPGSTFRQWLEFGRGVASRAKGWSEAGLILFYRPKDGSWGAYPPRQDLSSVKVDFSGVSACIEKFRKEFGADWLMAGTLHTHPGEASPSETDVEDEKKLDGLHLICPDFGKQENRGVVGHMTCSGRRFFIRKPIEFLIDWNASGTETVPDKWYSEITFGEGRGKGKGYYAGGHGYGGESYGSGSYHTFRGEGPYDHKVTVNDVDLNLVSRFFENVDPGPLLKKLKFPKTHRKFLMANFEQDFVDLMECFDHAREALKYVKEIHGQISEHEHGEIVDKIGRAAESVLDTMVSMANRMIEQASGEKPADSNGKEDDGKEESEVKADPPAAEAASDFREV